MKRLAVALAAIGLALGAQAAAVTFDFSDAKTHDQGGYFDPDPVHRINFIGQVSREPGNVSLYGLYVIAYLYDGGLGHLARGSDVVATFDYRTAPGFTGEAMVSGWTFASGIINQISLPATNGEWVRAAFSSASPLQSMHFDTLPGSLAGLIWVDNLTLAAIPEPATFALFGAGLAAMIGLRRRKDTRKQA